MRLSFVISRIVIYEIETLFANVIDQPLDLSLVIVSFYQSQIEHCRRRCRNDIASQRSDIAAADPIDVERWLID